MQILFSNNTNIEYSANIIIQSEFQLMNEPERPDPKSLWKCVCLIATEMSTYQNELCEKKYKFLYLDRSAEADLKLLTCTIVAQQRNTMPSHSEFQCHTRFKQSEMI